MNGCIDGVKAAGVDRCGLCRLQVLTGLIRFAARSGIGAGWL